MNYGFEGVTMEYFGEEALRVGSRLEDWLQQLSYRGHTKQDVWVERVKAYKYLRTSGLTQDTARHLFNLFYGIEE
jgi:hypothetical protein